MQEWAAGKGWSNRVKVKLAKHSEVPRYLGCMDLLVAPSQTMKNWREQFGRMIIEAFACGVPVIGSDSGEIPFVIGDAGLVVAETDVAGWAQAIRATPGQPGRAGRVEESRLGARLRGTPSLTIAQQYGGLLQMARWPAARPPAP